VVAANAYNGDQCKVWIDWDQNGEFDEDEIQLDVDNNMGYFVGNVNVPKGVPQGATGMRIRLSSPGKLVAYGDTEYGEVEDYTVLIENWLSLSPDQGVVSPGDSVLVDVTFNAEGLTVGSYDDYVGIITNDLETPTYYVDFTLHVTDMSLTAIADPEVICLGASTQLTAVANGGLGSYQYSWTSVPEGFTSNDESPMVTPEENTTYFVSVTDGSVILDASVSIIVNELPIVNLGEDEILCGETQTELDAGNPGSEYLWSTDEITQTIIGSGSGVTMFWAEVTNENGCKGYDTVYVDFAEIPIVELGSDTTLCGGATITLDAGNVGSTYLWSNLETTQTIVVDTLGFGYGQQDISLTVTNESGCNNNGEINVEFVDCTGISELTDVDIKVYPNPSNGIFTISLSSDANKPVSINIINANGKVVQKFNDIFISGTYSQKVDLSEYSDGIYTISILKDGLSKSTRVVLRK